MKHYRQESGMNLIANFAVLASRRAIFDLPVCDLGWDDALVFINELLSVPVGQTSISFVNAHNMLMTLRDSEYRAILAQNLVLPDGIGLNIASKIAHGSPFPANLNGTDFVPALLTFMEQPRRVGLIGGKPEVVERAAANFRRHAPWHEFIVISDGYFDKDDASDVVAEIERRKPDILIVGMGTPLQEKWAYHTIRSDHARLVLTVGALFDFVSGTVPRAPKIVRAMRLEWAYRLVQEPARLWRRYVIGIPLFLYFVLQYRFSRRARILKRSA
jgi:exopolysaccharide biosynthesis WecB/TagA/CpsF family protein